MTLFCALLGGGVNAARLPNFICSRLDFRVLLCLLVNFMALSYGSEMGEVVLFASLTGYYLFVCVAPEFTHL